MIKDFILKSSFFKCGFLYLFAQLISFESSSQGSKNIELLDNWFEDSIITNSTESRFNDCLGFVQNKKEYALIGSTEGIHFFSIEENKFVQKDFVKGTFSSTSVVHRDIKVYKQYAYAVCDEGSSALQIIDLSYLPDSVHLAAEISADFGRVHNIFIDTTNDLLYACSVTPIVNGNPTQLIPLRVFSLVNPLNPALLYQGPNGLDQVHDCYVRDNIAYLNCGYDGVRVYNFSNPSAPIYLQNLSFYQDQGFNHQGWLTPDGTEYFFGDETMGKKLKKCSVGSNHQLAINNYFGVNVENNSVPHNMMATNEFLFVAYYNEGLRIFDINQYPTEIAHYDTYPIDYFYKLNGAWGIYSELPSERLIVSDRQSGLYLFDFDRSAFKPQSDNVFVYPTIQFGGKEITLQLQADLANGFDVELISTEGKIVAKESFQNQTYGRIIVPVEPGVYFLKTHYRDYLDDEVIELNRIIVTN